MATLLNDRNELLFSASSRVTGATVLVTPGAATSLIVPRGASETTPAAITLSAITTGYITPAYVWSYRFGDTGTFVTLTATTNPITITCDAAFLTAAGSNTIVQYRVQVNETTSNIGINQSEFTLSIPILREGENGVDAINSVQITLYRRTLTNATPPVVTTGNSTYTFSNAQVVGQPVDWTQTIPSSVNGPYLWAIQELAASVGSSYQFSNTLWSAPVLYAQDGTNGLNGANTALVYAYKRAATAPTDNPGAVDYSFTTNQITTVTLANNWQKTIPSGTDPLYVALTTASSTGTTDSILATEWTGSVLLVQNGAPGADGTPGINSATIYLYARNNNSSTAPELITTGSGTYTFATGVLSGTIPSNWTQALPPESFGSVIWIVQATAAAITATDTIDNTEWGTPRVLAQIGADGSPGSIGTRGSRQLYSSDAGYSMSYTYNGNTAGAASFAVKATDLIAVATVNSIPTTPIEGDTVTFSGTNFAYTITYNASTGLWQAPGTVIDGSLLVTGSVTAAKINSNGLEVRDTSGTVILSTTIKLGETYIADAAITSAKIRSAAIGTAQIANAAIGTAQIANAAIGTAQIANAAIGTAQIGAAAVNTLQLAGQAVTIPLGAFTAGSISTGGSTYQTIQQLTITSTGNPIMVVTSASYTSNFGDFALFRDGTALASSSGRPVFVVRDTPGVGTFTYYLKSRELYSGGPATTSSSRGIILLEAKR